MSEIHLYEFRKFEGELGETALEEIASISRRAEVSAKSAIFVYESGKMLGDPLSLLERHFDALFYRSNWGRRQLAFRFQKNDSLEKGLHAFEIGKSIHTLSREKCLILNVRIDDERRNGRNDNDEGALTRFGSFYEEIIAEDFRSLFLLWMHAALMERKDEASLPPIPLGLRELLTSHKGVIAFFDISEDLVAAAQYFSASVRRATGEDLAKLVDLLPEEVKTAFLKQLIADTAPLTVLIDLKKRLQALLTSRSKGAVTTLPVPSSVGFLFERAAEMKVAREKRERANEMSKRMTRLAELDRDREMLWSRVDELIGKENTKSYEEAVAILKDLRELAVHQRKHAEFAQKIEGLHEAHQKLIGLRARIHGAKLV